LDPPAIAYFLGLGYWLISKVRVSSLGRARDSIDLVAASVRPTHYAAESAHSTPIPQAMADHAVPGGNA
jgi:hypothetical protein